MLSKGFLELARKLVAANTVSSEGTRQAADLLQTLWEHAGLAVRRQVVDGVHVNLAGGPGGGAAGAGGVLLVTHLDTVPPGPLDKWQTDPWTLTERDGFLYGLGCADVKLDALCKAEAARRLQGHKTRRPFWLLGTFGEEVGLRGARHFVASELFRQIAPSQVLCGEPSELQIISAHKGYAVVRCAIRDRKARTVGSEGPGIEQLEFSGKAAHSSTPHLGENAILKALAWVKSSGSPVVAARGGSGTNVVPASCLLEVPAPRERGQPEPAATRFLPPRAPQPNLWRALATASALEELWQRSLPSGSDARFDPAGAVGGLNVLESGEDAVVLQLDARVLPTHDPDSLIGQFSAQAQTWVEQLGQGELELSVSVERNASGMSLPDDAPLIRAAGAALSRHGLDPRPRAKPTSTEAGVFARAGCEAIVIGPGRSTANAHTPNERIEMAQLEKACDLYESLLVELCACT
ncbi:MAG: M20/M25/M40 family metallo-hydrolase [Deltaproteobacteria bacterium]|nr:MAG: M20/M25/M40 family metallo-hydrolase [Deltaproteobacteria bacterium]